MICMGIYILCIVIYVYMCIQIEYKYYISFYTSISTSKQYEEAKKKFKVCLTNIFYINIILSMSELYSKESMYVVV